MKRRRWLIVHPDTDRERTVPLEQPVSQVGRGREATVRFDSKNVSSLHASIVLREQSASVIDLDSTNGTLLNGKRVQTAELHDGDRLELADVDLVFREEEVPDEPVSSGRETETYLAVPGGVSAERLRDILRQAADDGWLDVDEADSIVESWETLQGSSRRLDALHAILERVLRVTERGELVRTILAEMGALLALDVVGLYLRDEPRFYILEGGQLSVESQTDTVSETLVDRVLRSAAPVMLENIGDDSSILGFESLMQMKIQSVLCLPVILRNQESLGALYCVSRQSGQLRLLERDRVFLSACSTVVALALENIMLVSKAQERARAEERTVQRRRYSPVIHRLQQERENLSLKLHDFRATRLYGLDEPANQELQTFVEKAVRADVPVLLLGETGVGKTALAHYLHEQSRPSLPFVTVDCAAISADLIESELFGHEKGAFTGAYARKTGKVAAAGRGTVFIDEIGDLNPRLQGKLLRLIESGEYEPVGSTRTQRSTARLVFATNRDLAAEVEAKTFREDLYYRLNVLCHTIAPLYERKEFILPLAEYFLKVYATRMGSEVEGFTEKAREAMLAHRWPGNIRELENAVMRALIEVPQGRIDAGALQLTEHSTTPAQAAGERKVSALEDLDLKAARERLDREYIERALVLCDRNVSQAARKLNLSRNSLSDLIKKYNL